MDERTTNIIEAREKIRHANDEIVQAERFIQKLEEEQEQERNDAYLVVDEIDKSSIEYKVGYESGKTAQFVPMIILMLVALAVGVIIGRIM